MRATLLSIPAFLATLSAAGYVLQDDYGNSASFFDKFDFFTVRDASGPNQLANTLRAATQPTASSTTSTEAPPKAMA